MGDGGEKEKLKKRKETRAEKKLNGREKGK